MPHIKSIQIAAITGVLLLFPFISHANTPLKSPYPTYLNVPSNNNISEYEGKCPKAPKAVHDMKYTSVYTDRSNGLSVIDRKAQKKYRSQTAPIKKYERQIHKWNEEIFSDDLENTKPLLCSSVWLKKWAEENSLLDGEVTFQGEATRKWTLASLSSHYLQIKNIKEFPADDKKIIEEWLNNIAQQVIQDYEKKPESKSRNNNHMYWAAWAAMITGVATNNHSFYDWGLTHYQKATKSIESDGTLPLEMFREGKAFLYHAFAAAPLILMAETATINGANMYIYNNGAIKKLVERVITELNTNQAYITQKTGVEQDLEGALTSSHLAWLEIYNARYPSKEARDWLEKLRPMIQRRTGGNMTRLFAVEKITAQDMDK